MAVPTISQVRKHAAVSIVLKQDQRTGRQVQGSVQEVLTRGNHPRGIKVQLQDGRIGRVQRMVDGDIVAASDNELQRDLQNQNVARGSGSRGRGGPRQHLPGRLSNRYTDVRQNEQLAVPSTKLNLMAFVKENKHDRALNRAIRRGSLPVDEGVPVTTETPTNWNTTALCVCPVCETFEGNEETVSNHVSEAHCGP